jgi:hypothetical protein
MSAAAVEEAAVEAYVKRCLQTNCSPVSDLNFPDGLKEFLVLLGKELLYLFEFACVLILRIPNALPKLENSLLFSLLAGNCRKETGSRSTATATTRFLVFEFFP